MKKTLKYKKKGRRIESISHSWTNFPSTLSTRLLNALKEKNLLIPRKFIGLRVVFNWANLSGVQWRQNLFSLNVEICVLKKKKKFSFFLHSRRLTRCAFFTLQFTYFFYYRHFITMENNKQIACVFFSLSFSPCL